MKFKQEFLSQKQIGSLFGVTSHIVGRWLVQLGLRDECTKRPTADAHRDGYCGQIWSGAHYTWAWHAEKTVLALQEAGHKLVADPPLDLVEPPSLTGPFRISAEDGREVLDADGVVCVRTASRSNSEVILRILEAAHRTGALTRLAQSQSSCSRG